MEYYCWFAIVGRVSKTDFLRRVILLEDILANHLFILVKLLIIFAVNSYLDLVYLGIPLIPFQSWQNLGDGDLFLGAVSYED